MDREHRDYLKDKIEEQREAIEDLKAERDDLLEVVVALRDELDEWKTATEELGADFKEALIEQGYAELALQGVKDDRDALQARVSELESEVTTYGHALDDMRFAYETSTETVRVRKLTEQKDELLRQLEDKRPANQELAVEALLDNADEETLRMLVREFLFQ